VTGLRQRSSRVLWGWCLAYTTLVPAAPRERRRQEILGHLWEAERAGLRPRQLASAAARGLGHDLSWALRRGGPALAATPGVWVALAALLPVTAWIASLFASPSSANAIQRVAMLGSFALLAVSLWLWARGRAPRS
jgi:hypothetical protein